MTRFLALLLTIAPVTVTGAGTAPAISVCYGYHCNHVKTVELRDAHWRIITNLFSDPANSADQERKRIARAIALFEKFVGEITGTSADLRGNVVGSTLPGQQDCIDESTNTTTYINTLEQAGFLQWHHLEDRVRRAPRIFDVHWTAVIRDHSDDNLYAVDSWFLDNGLEPYVQLLGAWRKKAPLPFNPDALE